MDRDRRVMVREQLRGRNIRDERVLDAMLAVPREAFVPDSVRGRAYEDRPLGIGFGQTISQPYIVARMLELLAVGEDDVVLDVGTGSGYMAAVLSQMVRKVCTIELEPELVERAREAIESLGIGNVEVRQGDGYAGWPEGGRFAGIVVSCAPVFPPEALLGQLAPGGRMVIPVGGEMQVQRLMVFERGLDGAVMSQQDIPVRFVPMRHG